MANKSGKNSELKIIIAMSGGVDSSVVAALLKNQGYHVIGIFLRLWNEKKGILADGMESAKNIAKILDIPLEIIDVSRDFKKEVIGYTWREFQAGRTPNPCCICNPKIKFSKLLAIAKKKKADYVATGHYARLKKCKVQSRVLGTKFKIKERIKYILSEAKDKTKDQSYFLYGLTQKQMAKIIFPLGNYKKTEVKKIAKDMGLPVYERKESHDVCFVSGKLEDYLKKNIRLKVGKIENEAGDVIGEHQGLPLYTLGQRKGIEIGGSGPYYVIEKKMRQNRLIVSRVPEKSSLYRGSMRVRSVNWINHSILSSRLKVRIRYGHPAFNAIIKKIAGRPSSVQVIFNQRQRAITPGQAAVFYSRSGEVLGGGIIK